MGMGMLFAGALSGGARAMGELADDAMKRREREELRAQSMTDRRQALLEEMELKERFALGQEQRDALSYQGAMDAGQTAGGERRFAKFAAEVRGAGGGEGMDDAQLREVFDAHYDDKVGGERYGEPESARKRDALDAARKAGASGKVLQALGDDYRATVQAERQAQVDASREAREDRRSREAVERDERRHRENLERDAARYDRQESMLDRRLSAQAARGGGGRGDSPEKEGGLSDVQKARLKPLGNELDAAMKALDGARPSQAAAAKERYNSALSAYNEMLDAASSKGGAPERAPQKNVTQESPVKGNRTPNNGAKPTNSNEAVLNDARRALAKHPGQRAEIERRLKGVGIDPRNL